MRVRLARPLAFATDLVIIVGTIALIVRASGSPRTSARVAQTTAAELSFGPGHLLSIEGVEWHQGDRTVLLALQTKCPACNRSVDFYRKLFAACATSSGCRDCLIATEPRDTVREWVQANHITARHIATVARPVDLGLHTTPTLAIIDARGVITDVGVGVLTRAEEERFLARMNRQPGVEPVNTERQPTIISAEEDLPAFVRRLNVHLLDLRERDDCAVSRHSAATCLPLRELKVRAPIEFERDAVLVVDCSRVTSTACRQATDQLFRDGFRNVFAAVVTGKTGAEEKP